MLLYDGFLWLPIGGERPVLLSLHLLKVISSSECFRLCFCGVFVCMHLTTAILLSSVPADSTIPKDIEQATGLEKAELDALMAGVEVRQPQPVHAREG